MQDQDYREEQMMDETTTLPEPAELIRMARAGNVPEAFFDTTEAMRQLDDELAEKRADLHDLIREAHALGVGPAVLARWSGYNPSRVYQILDAVSTR